MGAKNTVSVLVHTAVACLQATALKILTAVDSTVTIKVEISSSGLHHVIGAVDVSAVNSSVAIHIESENPVLTLIVLSVTICVNDIALTLGAVMTGLSPRTLPATIKIDVHAIALISGGSALEEVGARTITKQVILVRVVALRHIHVRHNV